MHIDKFSYDGGYKDPDDCYWEDAESYLQGYVLGFCCCGKPDANLKFLAEVLKHIDNLTEYVHKKHMSYDEWVVEGSNIASQPVLYFVYYFLDTKELTEHGGSVPGWLTDKGREFMEDVNELFDN